MRGICNRLNEVIWHRLAFSFFILIFIWISLVFAASPSTCFMIQEVSWFVLPRVMPMWFFLNFYTLPGFVMVFFYVCRYAGFNSDFCQIRGIGG